MKPSSSCSVNVIEFSIDMPLWVTREIILGMVPSLNICAAILADAGEPATDSSAWCCGLIG